ncbi:hypothetical protein TorRG33x02_265260, partial [Trema orientale]
MIMMMTRSTGQGSNFALRDKSDFNHWNKGKSSSGIALKTGHTPDPTIIDELEDLDEEKVALLTKNYAKFFRRNMKKNNSGSKGKQSQAKGDDESSSSEQQTDGEMSDEESEKQSAYNQMYTQWVSATSRALALEKKLTISEAARQESLADIEKLKSELVKKQQMLDQVNQELSKANETINGFQTGSVALAKVLSTGKRPGDKTGLGYVLESDVVLLVAAGSNCARRGESSITSAVHDFPLYSCSLAYLSTQDKD